MKIKTRIRTLAAMTALFTIMCTTFVYGALGSDDIVKMMVPDKAEIAYGPDIFDPSVDPNQPASSYKSVGVAISSTDMTMDEMVSFYTQAVQDLGATVTAEYVPTPTEPGWECKGTYDGGKSISIEVYRYQGGFLGVNVLIEFGDKLDDPNPNPDPDPNPDPGNGGTIKVPVSGF